MHISVHPIWVHRNLFNILFLYCRQEVESTIGRKAIDSFYAEFKDQLIKTVSKITYVLGIDIPSSLCNNLLIENSFKLPDAVFLHMHFLYATFPIKFIFVYCS